MHNNLFFEYMRCLSHSSTLAPCPPDSLRLLRPSRPLHTIHPLHTPRMLHTPRTLRTRPTQTFMDRASVYDTHNRVFYIYFLGNFNNCPIYHYGETNDLDANELYIKSHLPFYERVLYIPTDSNQYALKKFTEFIQNIRITLPIHKLEHLDAFTTNDIDNGIDSILQKVENLYHVNT